MSTLERARAILEKLEAAIEARQDGGNVERYVVGGKDISKASLGELNKAHAYWLGVVSSETVKALGKGWVQRTLVRYKPG